MGYRNSLNDFGNNEICHSASLIKIQQTSLGHFKITYNLKPAVDTD